MEARRKRNNIIIAVLVLALAAGLAAMPRLLRREEAEIPDGESILSASVARGDIRTTISGGGTLTETGAVEVTVPAGVEITEYLVSDGDYVTEGQPIAAVDSLSVRKTIVTVQENLDYLAQQMRRHPGYFGPDALYAQSAGRVKAIYAQVGDKVTDVMAEYGALAVVSLDGMLALQTETESDVIAGTAVTVRLSDGTEVPGYVDQRQGSLLTVTISDDGTPFGDEAEVYLDGERLGGGTLYAHSAWNVTATSGTVSYIAVRENRTVVVGTHLFNLKDVDASAAFRDLAEQHREYEEAMIRLYEIYDAGVITAPAEGRISGLDDTKLSRMSAVDAPFTVRLLAAAAPEPGTAKPGSYTNRYAVVGGITFGSITFYLGTGKANVTNYASAPNIDYNRVEATIFRKFDGVTLYEYNKNTKTWKEIGPSDLHSGDLLWFVYDANSKLMWILKPAQPVVVVHGSSEEVPFDMFDLTETTIGEVVPQETVTVEISIDELDILSVSAGQSAEVTIDALPGRAYTGTVTHVDPNGKNSGGSTRYTVTITIDREENMLAGMNATAILTVGVTESVLTLPTAALSQRGSSTLVYTGRDAETGALTDPVEIEIGVSDGQTVQVVSGLSEGDTVWYGYYDPSPFASAASGTIEVA